MVDGLADAPRLYLRQTVCGMSPYFSAIDTIGQDVWPWDNSVALRAPCHEHATRCETVSKCCEFSGTCSLHYLYDEHESWDWNYHVQSRACLTVIIILGRSCCCSHEVLARKYTRTTVHDLLMIVVSVTKPSKSNSKHDITTVARRTLSCRIWASLWTLESPLAFPSQATTKQKILPRYRFLWSVKTDTMSSAIVHRHCRPRRRITMHSPDTLSRKSSTTS